MSFITRGFRRRNRVEDAPPERIPPGQYVTRDFPVLSAGPTPRVPLEDWRFTVTDAGGNTLELTWSEFSTLPTETITVDIHCVTKWSKLDTTWEGVSLDTLFANVAAPGSHALFHSYGATQPICRSMTSPEGRPGSQSGMRASRWLPNMEGRPVFWCLISTSGKAPSGSGVSSSPTPTGPASGSRTAITTTGIHGWSSGTRATELACGRGRRVHRRDRSGPQHRSRSSRVAGSSPRPAHRPSADRRGRVSGSTELLNSSPG